MTRACGRAQDVAALKERAAAAEARAMDLQRQLEAAVAGGGCGAHAHFGAAHIGSASARMALVRPPTRYLKQTPKQFLKPHHLSPISNPVP